MKLLPRPGRRPPAERSIRHRLVTPLVVFLGVALGFVFLNVFGRGFIDSVLERLALQRPVHRDGSEISLEARRQARDRVSLVYQDRDGRRWRVAVERAELDAFARQAMERLEADRQAALEGLPGQVALAAAPVFADMEARVGRYADWYFAWATTYRIMGAALKSAGGHLLDPARAMDVQDAVAADLARYLYDHYRDIVLRPELNDPRLEAAFREAAAAVHGRFRGAVENLDAEFQRFVRGRSTLLDDLPPQGVAFHLDWDAQLRKVSMAGSYQKGDLGAAAGALLTATGAVVGGKIGAGLAGKALVGAAEQGLAAKLAAPFAGKAASAAVLGAGGAAAGAVAGPVGAVLGGGAGLLVDVLLNEGVELMQREAFEADTRDALAATRAEWEAKMAAALSAAADAWYTDAVQMLAAYRS